MTIVQYEMLAILRDGYVPAQRSGEWYFVNIRQLKSLYVVFRTNMNEVSSSIEEK